MRWTRDGGFPQAFSPCRTALDTLKVQKKAPLLRRLPSLRQLEVKVWRHPARLLPPPPLRRPRLARPTPRLRKLMLHPARAPPHHPPPPRHPPHSRRLLLRRRRKPGGAKTFTGKLEASTVNAANLSVSGAASVPTPNADNNSKTVANTAFVKTAIANLVGSAPSTLDTLQELSAALGNDANFSATVASQIGKKLDKAGGTITGPILYGKTPNDNSELPNKAYVDSAIKSAVNAAVASVTKTLSANMHAQYPVGCYLYSDKANNPATYLPYMSDTTWVQTAAGRVLIGAGEADSGTVYNAGATGGEEKHKLSVEELAPHMHQERMTTSDGNPNSLVNLETGGNLSGATVPQRFGYTHKATDTVNTVSAGGDKPHNNMEPYRVVYIFKRTV